MPGLVTTRRTLLYIVIVALAGAVLCVVAGAVVRAEDCAAPQCCACEPSAVAEPAPLPHLYLPAVMHGVRMSSEYTPFQPTPTPEPDVELPLGDASQEGAQ